MKLPDHDCPLCPRLCDFRAQNRVRFPDYFNGPVPPFASNVPRLLIVGLAPGLHGANNTGRPFTADYAGDLLYPTLVKFGFAKGEYKERADDGLELVGARITNAVRCVPPENKPLPAEIKTCNLFLKSEIAGVQKDLRVIVALGLIAHQAILKSLNIKQSAFKFAHGAEYQLPPLPASPPQAGERSLQNNSSPPFMGERLGEGVTLLSSYHCSRYNTSTKRLTVKIFEDIFARVREIVDQQTIRRAEEAQYGAK